MFFPSFFLFFPIVNPFLFLGSFEAKEQQSDTVGRLRLKRAREISKQRAARDSNCSQNGRGRSGPKIKIWEKNHGIGPKQQILFLFFVCFLLLTWGLKHVVFHSFVQA